MVKKIRELLTDIKKSPFRGPEPLKFDLQGYLSRRINREHRLVYNVESRKGAGQKCYVIQCRFHYD